MQEEEKLLEGDKFKNLSDAHEKLIAKYTELARWAEEVTPLINKPTVMLPPEVQVAYLMQNFIPEFEKLLMQLGAISKDQVEQFLAQQRLMVGVNKSVLPAQTLNHIAIMLELAITIKNTLLSIYTETAKNEATKH